MAITLPEPQQIEEKVGLLGGEDNNDVLTKSRTSRLAKVLHLRLAGELCMLAVLIWAVLTRRTTNTKEVAGDVTGVFPQFDRRVISFERDVAFVPEDSAHFLDADVEQKWVGLVPIGLGYVDVQEPSKYHDLPQPLDGFTNQTVFTTSMTHQLHCLHSIFKTYSTLMTDPFASMAGTESWHIPHCFDYLRQAIMCSGDVALEGNAVTFPPNVTGSDGWDALHTCKVYEQVYDFLEKNRASDMQWI